MTINDLHLLTLPQRKDTGSPNLHLQTLLQRETEPVSDQQPIAIAQTITRRTRLSIRLVINHSTLPLINPVLNINHIKFIPVKVLLNIIKIKPLMVDLVVRRFNINILTKNIGLKTGVTSSNIKTNVD